jgi:hypothetical protein
MSLNDPHKPPLSYDNQSRSPLSSNFLPPERQWVPSSADAGGPLTPYGPVNCTALRANTNPKPHD